MIPYSYDTTRPEMLPNLLDGAEAIKGSVWADPAGQWFDSERGNAGCVQVANAVKLRHDAGEWSIIYSDADRYPTQTAALADVGLVWSNAESWPDAGVYLWAVDLNIGPTLAVPWTPVRPLLVQFNWGFEFDLSLPAPNFPGRVAGYLDGDYVWPADAWARFAPVGSTPPPPPPPVPHPVPPPGPPSPIIPDLEVDHMHTQGITLHTSPAGAGWTPPGSPFLVARDRVIGAAINPNLSQPGTTRGSVHLAADGPGTYVEVSGCDPDRDVEVVLSIADPAA